LTQYNETLEAPETEKLSDLITHPHKARSLRNLLESVLHGHYLNFFNKSIQTKQSYVLDPNALIDYLLAFSSPATYNFNTKGNLRHLAISNSISQVVKHYSDRDVTFNNVFDKISKDLVSKIATKDYIFSTNNHRRAIAINLCGGLSGISSSFYEIVSQTFKLKSIIEQVKK
jgi:hypothetical protein